MKLKRFKNGSQFIIAAAYDSKWVPLLNLCTNLDIGTDLLKLLERWPAIKEDVLKALTNAGKDLPCIPENAVPVLPFAPRSLRDFMLFEAHAVNAGRGMIKRFKPNFYPWVKWVERVTKKPFKAIVPSKIWYRQPIYYFGNHLNMVGDKQEIFWPSYTRHLDYELEAAFVITKPLKNATATEAQEAIGGFMVLNDVSARDIQVPEMRSGMGPQKAKHFINAMSHEVTTADDVLPHIDALTGEVRINGKIVCTTSTRGMQHSVCQMLMHASKDEQLHPGEVFATGTLPNGCALENGHWLKPGDAIEMSIERIGSLSNTIVS